jgi:hypothetical protein
MMCTSPCKGEVDREAVGWGSIKQLNNAHKTPTPPPFRGRESKFSI